MRKHLLFCCLAGCLPAAAANLGGGEWFIGEDPGFGRGTAFTAPAATTASLSVTVPAARLNSLPAGAHLLGVRVRTSDGEWGHVLWRSFMKDQTSAQPVSNAAEWFIDQDPGQGRGEPFVVSGGRASVTVGSHRLTGGSHLLGVRARDESGRWGPVLWRPFLVDALSNLTIDYEIMVGDRTVATRTGVGLSSPEGVHHGKGSLEPGSSHRLRVTLVTEDGRRGTPVTGDFLYLSYAEAWRRSHFTAAERNNPLVSGWNADPDGDGRNNRLEMGFALNPRQPTDPVVSLVSQASVGEQRLSFRVPGGGVVGEDGVYRTSNLAYTLRESSNLTSWTKVAASSVSNWLLTPTGDGAARLQMSVAGNSGDLRFFSMELAD